MKKKILTNVVMTIILIILFLIFAFSIYKIISWNSDNKEINDITKLINEITEIKEVTDNDNIEKINPPEDEFDPYWDYIKLNLLEVDFNELIKINPDTVGWVYVGGTNINYPVVKCSNNSFYLNHDFNEKWNDGGWVFMDYRNNIDNLNQNTIIYGHSRLNKSLFGTLRNVVTKNWFNNKDNHIIKFSTQKENTLWQVFSVYTIKAEDYYITNSFENDSEYQTWINTMLDRSIYNFKTNVKTNDKVITLSSCYTNDGIRVVLHAKLIKMETR